MDQSELQAEIDALRGTQQVLHAGIDRGGVVHFREPIQLSEPIRLYSGITLEGEGPASRLEAGAGFAGSCLIQFTEIEPGPSARCSGATIRSLALRAPAGSGISAIGASTTPGFKAISNAIRDVYVDAPHGVVLPYAQECLIGGLHSYGPVESIVDITGTCTTIERVRQDGSQLGQGSEPYIGVTGSSGLVLRDVVIEGVGRVGKPGVVLDGCGGAVVDGLRVSPEASGSLDILRLVGCRGVSVRGELRTLSATRRIVVAGSRGVAFEMLPNPQSSLPLSAYLDVDASSYVLIRSLETRYAESLYRLDMAGRLRLDDVILAGVADEGVPGYVARDRVHIAPGPGNLFADPAFAQGDAFWPHPGSTAALTTGPLGGAALELSGLATGNRDVYQDVTIGQEMVGSGAMLSLGVLARVIGPGYLVPMPGGLVGTVKSYYHRISASAGWAMVPATVGPVATGTHHVGWRVYGHDATTRVLLSRPWLGSGPEAWLG